MSIEILRAIIAVCIIVFTISIVYLLLLLQKILKNILIVSERANKISKDFEDKVISPISNIGNFVKNLNLFFRRKKGGEK